MANKYRALFCNCLQSSLFLKNHFITTFYRERECKYVVCLGFTMENKFCFERAATSNIDLLKTWCRRLTPVYLCSLRVVEKSCDQHKLFSTTFNFDSCQPVVLVYIVVASPSCRAPLKCMIHCVFIFPKAVVTWLAVNWPKRKFKKFMKNITQSALKLNLVRQAFSLVLCILLEMMMVVETM